MWTFISGHIISYLFEYLIIKLYKNNFSNKNMSIVEISLGWLFQEHVREDFNMTSGKRFMLKKDFRNRFITNSVKIIRNIIFWSHAINTFELGTFLILLSLLTYLIIIQIITSEKQKSKYLAIEIFILFLLMIILYKQIKIYTTFLILLSLLTYLIWTKIILSKKIEYLVTELLVFFFLLVLITKGLKTYWLFDVFFITRPFIYFFFFFFLLFNIFWLLYLNYLLLNKYSKRFGLLIRTYLLKLLFLILFFIITLKLFILNFNIENLTNNNFFQELILKITVINFYFFKTEIYNAYN